LVAAIPTHLKRPADSRPRELQTSTVCGDTEEQRMQTAIQSSTTWQFDASITHTPYGYHVLITRFLPTARRPEHQVKFSGTFSSNELRTLRCIIDQALEASE